MEGRKIFIETRENTQRLRSSLDMDAELEEKTRFLMDKTGCDKVRR